jgi:hypothetical protein
VDHGARKRVGVQDGELGRGVGACLFYFILNRSLLMFFL